MKKTLMLLALLLACVSVAEGETKGLHRFYLDYAVVKHSLKNDEGLNELMALAKLDQKAADFLAEFWWIKAKKECISFVKEMNKLYADKIATATSQPEKEQLKEQAMREADQCFYGVYYDHWNEINQMIKKQYERALKKRQKE